jgi:hypothetical protein
MSLRNFMTGTQAGLRVTEQGEMVHGKFGTPDIAQVTMESFTTAVLEVRRPLPQCSLLTLTSLSPVSCLWCLLCCLGIPEIHPKTHLGSSPELQPVAETGTTLTISATHPRHGRRRTCTITS